MPRCVCVCVCGWSRWRRGLRRRSSAASLLGSWFRILLRAWTLLPCDRCVLCCNFRGLLSHARVCIVAWHLETSKIRCPRSYWGCCATEQSNVFTSVSMHVAFFFSQKWLYFDLLSFEVKPWLESLHCNCVKIIYCAHSGKRKWRF